MSPSVAEAGGNAQGALANNAPTVASGNNNNFAAEEQPTSGMSTR